MRGLLFLLSALFLLESTDGNKYNQLSQHETSIIDRAIKEANEKYGTKHIDFDSILQTDKDKGMLHVLLKSTSCDKTTPSVHRTDCKIQHNAKPQVSCVGCRGDMSCLLLKEIDKILQIRTQCLNYSQENVHHIGRGNLLFQKGRNEQQTGCLGCI